MLLEDKNAWFYGAGGPIGGVGARTFVREGVRVFFAGVPESREGISTEGWLGSPAGIEAQIKARSLLGRVTTLADVGNAAAFLASDLAGATPGTVFNLTSGTVVLVCIGCNHGGEDTR